jgi:hypothetical protein
MAAILAGQTAFSVKGAPFRRVAEASFAPLRHAAPGNLAAKVQWPDLHRRPLSVLRVTGAHHHLAMVASRT